MSYCKLIICLLLVGCGSESYMTDAEIQAETYRCYGQDLVPWRYYHEVDGITLGVLYMECLTEEEATTSVTISLREE